MDNLFGGLYGGMATPNEIFDPKIANTHGALPAGVMMPAPMGAPGQGLQQLPSVTGALSPAMAPATHQPQMLPPQASPVAQAATNQQAPLPPADMNAQQPQNMHSIMQSLPAPLQALLAGIMAKNQQAPATMAPMQEDKWNGPQQQLSKWGSFGKGFMDKAQMPSAGQFDAFKNAFADKMAGIGQGNMLSNDPYATP